MNPVLEALQRLDTCTVANAIETFQTRLLNEGFCDASIRCLFPNLPPMVGRAVTAKFRCSTPPPDERRQYADRTDWWNFIQTVPAPRVVVIEDVDPRPGFGSTEGEVHAAILQALGCVGVVTNGAVRDLPSVEALGFHFFANSVAVSHAYSHIVSIGGEVTIGGLKIKPGDLLHGDRHGVLAVPIEIAADIPQAAAQIADQERRLLALCRAPDFSVAKLRAALKEL